MQPVALRCVVYFRRGRLVSASTRTHAPHNHSTRNHMQLGTVPPLPSSLHLFPVSPGELVCGFSYFPEVCPLFPSLPCFLCDTSVNICGEEGRGGGVREAAAAVYSRQTADVLQIFSGPCDAGDAAEGSWRPAKSAIFCPYPPRSVRQW